MAEEGKNLRQKLRKAVLTALGDKLWDLKNTYSQDAGRKYKDNTYAKCLAQAARSNEKSYAEAAYSCAMNFKIGEKYAEFWGE